MYLKISYYYLPETKYQNVGLNLYPDFLFREDNATLYRRRSVGELLESEDVQRMDWPESSPNLKTV